MKRDYNREQALLAVKMAIYLERALPYIPAVHRERVQQLLDEHCASREAEHAEIEHE